MPGAGEADAAGWKRLAAERAAEMVRPGMVVGLGTGSTAAFAVAALGRALAGGRLPGIRGVPTSRRTEELARAEGIPLVCLDDVGTVDLTIDGADEVDPALDLIKGGGGALLREKIVASASRRNVVVADESKLVDRLGRRCALPVEVAAFGWTGHVAALERLGARVEPRLGPGGEPFVTAEGHRILDCRFPDGISDPPALEAQLRSRPGVVETGLFLGLTDVVVVAGASGLRVLERRHGRGRDEGTAPR
ncbi:MAG: ribose-5-phosphate isomerase RpiA [Gemmatimonadota bacterium]